MSDMSDTFGVNAPLFANSATLQRWQNIHRAQDCQMQSVITRCLNETDRRDVETRTTRHLSNRTLEQQDRNDMGDMSDMRPPRCDTRRLVIKLSHELS